MSIVASYNRQINKLRKVASEYIEQEKLSLMTDLMIENWAKKNFVILLDNEYPYDEVVYMIPKDVYDDIKDEIIILER